MRGSKVEPQLITCKEDPSIAPFFLYLTHTHTHTHVPRAWQAKTVKMGDRLEGKAMDSFDKKALKKVTVAICLYYLKTPQRLS